MNILTAIIFGNKNISPQKLHPLDYVSLLVIMIDDVVIPTYSVKLE
jgi:hypothetical protein